MVNYRFYKSNTENIQQSDRKDLILGDYSDTTMSTAVLDSADLSSQLALLMRLDNAAVTDGPRHFGYRKNPFVVATTTYFLSSPAILEADFEDSATDLQSQSYKFALANVLYEAIMSQDSAMVSDILNSQDITIRGFSLANISPVTLCVLFASWQNETLSTIILKKLLLHGAEVNARENRTPAKNTSLLLGCRKALPQIVGRFSYCTFVT